MLDERLISSLLCAWTLAIGTPGLARSQTSPTEPKTFFVPRDAVVAAGFFAAAGGLSVFDKRIAHLFEDTSLAHVRVGRDLDQVFTRINESTLTIGGLLAYGIGRLAHAPTVADVGLHTAESVAAASVTSQLIRGPLGRSRPQKTNFENQYDFHWFQGFTQFDYRSFPSIHSSSGFAAASVWVAETEYRKPGAVWLVAPLAYTIAITPGLSRMYLGQHWASDIFAGAFVGTFYGWRIVRYAHTHPGDGGPVLTIGGLRVGASRRQAFVSWSP